MTDDIKRMADSLAAFAFPLGGADRKLMADGIRSLMDIAHAAGLVEGAQMILARMAAMQVIAKAKEV